MRTEQMHDAQFCVIIGYKKERENDIDINSDR